MMALKPSSRVMRAMARNSSSTMMGAKPSNGSSNNSLTILAATVWENGGQNITIGTGAATGNVMTITGGTVTNVGVLNVGGSSTGSGTLTFNSGTLSVKSLLVTNNTVAAGMIIRALGDGTEEEDAGAAI